MTLPDYPMAPRKQGGTRATTAARVPRDGTPCLRRRPRPIFRGGPGPYTGCLSPIASRTSVMVREASSLAFRPPSFRTSSTRPDSAVTWAARSRMGSSSAFMLLKRTRLQSMHPHPAPRQFTATSSCVSTGEKALCRW